MGKSRREGKVHSASFVSPRTGNLFQVAQNLEAAVNSQVPIPQEFLATVHLWMKSRAQTESGLSQMQLAQFIGASSFNSQVQANVQMLAQRGNLLLYSPHALDRWIGCGRREPLDTDTPPDWSDDEAVPLRSWPWGETLVAPPTEETAQGGVSTWFPTCTGGEYNKYKSIWQEAVQSEKPR
ncbi:unnamed protein product, partial [Symbiodinium necroappetens]